MILFVRICNSELNFVYINQIFYSEYIRSNIIQQKYQIKYYTVKISVRNSINNYVLCYRLLIHSCIYINHNNDEHIHINKYILIIF